MLKKENKVGGSPQTTDEQQDLKRQENGQNNQTGRKLDTRTKIQAIIWQGSEGKWLVYIYICIYMGANYREIRGRCVVR